MEAWTRATRPPSESRSAPSSGSMMFTDTSGREMFHGIVRSSGGDKHKKAVTQKMVTPVQSALERTKEREQTSDAPNDDNISLNVAAVSNKTKPKKPKKRSSSSRSSIKRLMTSRRNQSNSRRGTSKTSTTKKTKTKKKKK